MDKSEQEEKSSHEINEFSKLIQELTLKSQEVVRCYLEQSPSSVDSFIISQINAAIMAYQQLVTMLALNPSKTVEIQLYYWQDLTMLYQRSMLTWCSSVADTETIGVDDKRFRNPLWQQHPLYIFFKQFYLLNVKHLLSLTNEVDGFDTGSAKKIHFYTSQFLNALSPTNFFITNPDVLQDFANTGGKSLLQGMDNLFHDLKRGKGRLNITMTDPSPFEIGKNIAVTPGKVIYQNAIMQLIQYSATTSKVYKNPLLLIPPMINKFYILDLSERNSFAKWLVTQGYTVYMISWASATAELREKDFQDYMLEGPLAAMNVIEKIVGKNKINMLGFCIGGTLLACLLAYLADKNDQRVGSATYLTTMLDFAEPGDLGMFIDEYQVAGLEKQLNTEGYLNGNILALIFNMLRPNDLIWNYYIRNYLQGKKPIPIDLLYWNSDPTNLAAKMAQTYLREMYLKNRLKDSGGMVFDNVPIVLNKIKTPVYFLSNQNDHIAPWKSTYAGVALHSGPVSFVLGGAGHIAGVVNPPSNNKYSYFTNESLPENPETWLQTAEQQPGSWWPHWESWLRKYSGTQVAARVPGSGSTRVIEDAPGSYVRVQLVDR